MGPFQQYLMNARDYLNQYPSLRYGQAAMNVLSEMHPEVYRLVSIDVWENDGNTEEEAEQLIRYFDEVNALLTIQN